MRRIYSARLLAKPRFRFVHIIILLYTPTTDDWWRWKRWNLFAFARAEFSSLPTAGYIGTVSNILLYLLFTYKHKLIYYISVLVIFVATVVCSRRIALNSPVARRGNRNGGIFIYSIYSYYNICIWVIYHTANG